MLPDDWALKLALTWRVPTSSYSFSSTLCLAGFSPKSPIYSPLLLCLVWWMAGNFLIPWSDAWPRHLHQGCCRDRFPQPLKTPMSVSGLAPLLRGWESSEQGEQAWAEGKRVALHWTRRPPNPMSISGALGIEPRRPVFGWGLPREECSLWRVWGLVLGRGSVLCPPQVALWAAGEWAPWGWRGRSPWCITDSSEHSQPSTLLKVPAVHVSDLSYSSVCLASSLIFLYMYVHAKSLQSCPTLWPHGPKPTRLLCPWDSPGKNTGVVCHALLQGIFPTQRSNPCLYVSCIVRWVLYH